MTNMASSGCFPYFLYMSVCQMAIRAEARRAKVSIAMPNVPNVSKVGESYR